MKSLGMEVSRSEVSQMIEDVDPRGTGSIDFSDFVSVIARKMKNTDKEEVILNAFATFDEKNTGYISVSELREILSTLGDKLTDKEVWDCKTNKQTASK